MNTQWNNSARNLYNNNSSFQKNKRFLYSSIGTFFCLGLLILGIIVFFFSFKKKK